MLPGPWEAKRITPLAGDITRIHLPPAAAAKAPSLVNVSLLAPLALTPALCWRHPKGSRLRFLASLTPAPEY